MELNIKRVYDLLVRFLAENTRTLVKVIVAICGLVLAIALIDHYNNIRMEFKPTVILMYVFMFLGGSVFTSKIFKEFHSPGKSYRYLTLPASNLEKLVFAWILSSPLLVVVFYLLINLISWLVIVFVVPVYGIRIEYLDLFADYNFGKMAILYMIIQSVFLLGAITFRKIQFINTLLSLLAIHLFFAIITAIVVLLIFPIKGFDTFNIDFALQASSLEQFFEEVFVPFISFVFYYLLAPFLIVITYFKVKEKEIS